MQHETFCTYEQAVKLKKLGFDWRCYEFWNTTMHVDGVPVVVHQTAHGPRVYVISECNSVLEKMGSDLITAPSMAVAQRWLRETRSIYVESGFVFESCFEVFIKSQRLSICKRVDKIFDTYEAALSVGIDEALKLLATSTNESKQSL